jgi:hypothetical protein
LKTKFDMVAMLGDIEIAQALQQDGPDTDEHPTDTKYSQLCTKLTPMDAKSATYKVIEKVSMIGLSFAFVCPCYSLKACPACVDPEAENPERSTLHIVSTHRSGCAHWTSPA